MKSDDLKVALVCDWLIGFGGAERVVLELHRMFPHAPIYTSQYNPKAINWFDDADVRTLWLQRLPKSLKKFLPMLRARAFNNLDLSEYDLVISASGAEAKAVKTGPGTLHITYCHAPTHYYWNRYKQYIAHPGFGLLNPLARLGLRAFVNPLRKRDFQAAQKPTYFIANSSYTKKQIKKYYGRDSTIVHPPVDSKRFKPDGKAIRNGFLIAGRQTPYKRFDLAVAACTELDIPLKVIGDGPEHNKLVNMAGPRVTFLTKVADRDMPYHFQRAEGFIFPGLDDFGIVAVEALAAGTPVVAYKDGGALDYVNSKTGIFFEKQNVPSLMNALSEFEPESFQTKELVAKAKSFAPPIFKRNTTRLINKYMV